MQLSARKDGPRSTVFHFHGLRSFESRRIETQGETARVISARIRICCAEVCLRNYVETAILKSTILILPAKRTSKTTFAVIRPTGKVGRATLETRVTRMTIRELRKLIKQL